MNSNLHRYFILLKSSLILLILILHSCKTESKDYFKFDEAVHFKLNPIINNDSIFPDKIKSEIDSLRKQIIIGDRPDKISDSIFINDLEKNGFDKIKIDPSSNEKINDIYQKKSSPIFKTSMACEPVYRDILIFKKNQKTIGISKICFECDKSINIGINGKLASFERKSDFENLKKVLKNE